MAAVEFLRKARDAAAERWAEATSGIGSASFAPMVGGTYVGEGEFPSGSDRGGGEADGEDHGRQKLAFLKIT